LSNLTNKAQINNKGSDREQHDHHQSDKDEDGASLATAFPLVKSSHVAHSLARS
jgi:hypothetical protein